MSHPPRLVSPAGTHSHPVQGEPGRHGGTECDTCVSPRHVAVMVGWTEGTLEVGRDQQADWSPGSAARALRTRNVPAPSQGSFSASGGTSGPVGADGEPWVACASRRGPSLTLPLPAHVHISGYADIPHRSSPLLASSSAIFFCSKSPSLEDTYGLSLRGTGSILCGLKVMHAFC